MSQRKRAREESNNVQQESEADKINRLEQRVRELEDAVRSKNHAAVSSSGSSKPVSASGTKQEGKQCMKKPAGIPSGAIVSADGTGHKRSRTEGSLNAVKCSSCDFIGKWSKMDSWKECLSDHHDAQFVWIYRCVTCTKE